MNGELTKITDSNAFGSRTENEEKSEDGGGGAPELENHVLLP
jgi:hypothetical protein